MEVEFEHVQEEIFNITSSVTDYSFVMSSYGQDNTIELENIALDLEYEYFEKDGFDTNVTSKPYSRSWLEKKEDIDFKAHNQPDWVSFNHSECIINMSSTITYNYKFTTSHEFEISTMYHGKEYKKPITIQVDMWNASYWIECYNDIKTHKCTKCMPGYNLNIDQTKCTKVYSIGCAKDLYTVLAIISVITIFYFIVLWISGSKVIIHLILYIENKSLFIFISRLYLEKMPKYLYFDESTYNLSNKFSVYLPFSPLINLIYYLCTLVIPSSNGYLPYTSQYIELLSFVWIIMLFCALISLILLKTCKHRNQYNIAIWFIFKLIALIVIFTNILFSQYLPIQGYYIPWVLESNLPKIIVLLVIWVGFLHELINQITLGETWYKFLGVHLIDHIKPDVKSRTIVFAWLVKMLLSKIVESIIWMI